MNRRASLPGVDELFGSSAKGGLPEQAVADAAATTAAASQIDARVLAGVRRLTAAEDDAVVEARDRAGDSASLPSPEVGALLRWAAVTCQARTIVEIGAATGVSGLWLLPSLPPRGVLTSIEPDPHAHALAAEAFQRVQAGPRVRCILGEPDTVLPRLSDGAYDLVVLQTSPATYPEALEHARRLLRSGGMLVARGVLRPGEHGDALARFVQALADDAGFTAAVLPVDEGIAVATRLEFPDEDAAPS